MASKTAPRLSFCSIPKTDRMPHGYKAFNFYSANPARTADIQGMVGRGKGRTKPITLELARLDTSGYMYYQVCNEMQWLPHAFTWYLHHTFKWDTVRDHEAGVVLNAEEKSELLSKVVPWHWNTCNKKHLGELRVCNRMDITAEHPSRQHQNMLVSVCQSTRM